MMRCQANTIHPNIQFDHKMKKVIALAIVTFLLSTYSCKKEHDEPVTDSVNDSITYGFPDYVIIESIYYKYDENNPLLQSTETKEPVIDNDRYIPLSRKIYKLTPNRYAGITFDITKVERNLELLYAGCGEDMICDYWPSTDLLCTITATNGFELIAPKNYSTPFLFLGDTVAKTSAWTNSSTFPPIEIFPPKTNQATHNTYIGIREIQENDTLYGWLRFEICKEEPCVKEIFLQH